MTALLAIILTTQLHAQQPAPAPRQGVEPPPPTNWYDPAYQVWLYNFLGSRQYEKLGWPQDKSVRDTGPYIDKTSYGTHNAVRIFYSPEVINWMKGGRKGEIPDGAMIVKEMFNPPAARYDSMSSAQLRDSVSGWAVMVKDKDASKDGWYWSYYAPGIKPDNPAKYPYDYPNSGIGLYCVRCHASAASEFTFSSLTNVQGYPGEPITFRVDDSWIKPMVSHTTAEMQRDPGSHDKLASGTDLPAAMEILPSHSPNPLFHQFYSDVQDVPMGKLVGIPPLTYDHVISGPNGPSQFMTSDQCLSCHDGQPLNLGPNMYFPDSSGKGGINLSPYGEWNWSMMGLSGRDPIFYAQLESEVTYQPSHGPMIQNLCFTCHGVMGQRQLAIDHPGDLFNRDLVQITDPSNPISKYGGLARDGVSCTVCHQIVDDKEPLDSIFTGRFKLSTPGEFEKGFATIYGPFTSPSQMAMRTSLGLTPVQNDYTLSSRLCGSCHTVQLPVFNKAGNQVGQFFEQATYLEWLNSTYQNELKPNGKDVKTCQNCHMPTSYPDEPGGLPLSFRIANIQDITYPQADERAPLDSITVPIRPNFARHTLLGVNVFALEMFNQFDSLLGVRKTDYMTSSPFGLPFAIRQADFQAKKKSAMVEITGLTRNGRQLTANVKVTNLTGHRFPSGVGFRRAFLELKVVDPQGKVLWISGRTNDLGILIGKDGKPLPSEFHEVNSQTGKQIYQPHYTKIDREDQVQIFEELIQSPEGKFTTSFLNLETVVKDNRLLPIGWTKDGPPGFRWAEATMPHGEAAHDPEFTNGKGSDALSYVIDLPEEALKDARVVATLYYQSIPPDYLRDRLTTSPNSPPTQRLGYLVEHLQLKGTPAAGWKLQIGSAAMDVQDRGRRTKMQ